jgi:hypothetical protein
MADMSSVVKRIDAWAAMHAILLQSGYGCVAWSLG